MSLKRGHDSTNSVAAKLTIVPDTFPPQITGVGSLQKTSGAIEIGIGFDEELDPVSAGTASNYKLSSGMVTGVRFEKYVTEVGAVVLATSGLTPGANTTVTVTGVKDLKGNTMAATQKPVSITSRLKWAAVGGDDYIQAGGSAAIWPDDAVAISDRDFDLVSSGSANWDNYDEITFAYESVTGDFDKVVRVEYQDPTSQWARAGLMARAALDEGVDRATSTGGTYETSQAMFIRVNPTVQWDGTPGNNAWEFVWRDTPGGNCANTGGGGIPLYPNAWIRMQRTGQVFTGYRSDDGQTWINIGTHTFPVDNPLPNALFVGPYYSPELGNNGTKDGIGHSTVARFRDYGNFGLSAPPEITAVTFSGGNVTITWAGGGTLQSTTTLSAPSWNNETGNGTFTAPATGNKYFRVAR